MYTICVVMKARRSIRGNSHLIAVDVGGGVGA